MVSPMPPVTPADLSTYLGAPVDEDRAQMLLDLSVSLCESVVSPLPESATTVVLDVAARGYINPTNAQSQTAGPFSATYGSVSGGLWLTRQNKATLRRLGGTGGAFMIDMLPADAGSRLPWWDWGGPFYSDTGTVW